ncbi:PRP1 splicing factor, partial [Helicosporidium sp. ATCC 50920]
HPNARGPGVPGAKIDFNALKAPANYRPGLGRGASGFTTRSDIGPSMPAPDVPKEADDEGKFDAFLGNDSGVLAGSGAYDEEDREADQIWEQVDQRMEERRKTQREAKEAEALEKFRERNPKISEQFADLKRKLTSVSESEWDAIPDIGDTTIRKPKRAAIFTPAPDSLLARAAGGGLGNTVVEPEGGASIVPGTATDLTAVGQGRSTVVQLNLDRVSDSVSGQTVVDPKGYLTDMKSMVLKSDAEVSDIKKARLLL